ncbi:MAG TPA: CinA family protein [Spirochaetota bacterium]|nr:CinA family protein [Spirochaetota bacterium]
MIAKILSKNTPPDEYGRRFAFFQIVDHPEKGSTPTIPDETFLISRRESDPWTAVIRWARHYGVRLACAESCTGGLVSAGLTAIAGASRVVMGGVVAYDNRVKRDLLKVPADCLGRFGAVSEECACGMADGCRELFGVDLAISVTGIAGPGGAVPGKPVGTVCFARATRSGIDSLRCQFSGTRDEIRVQAAEMACAILLLTIREGAGYEGLSGYSTW